MTWARELVENNSVETKRYTMAELYELRRLNYQALALHAARTRPQ